MHFKEENTGQFLEIFQKHKASIRNVPGCTHLELHKDISHPNVYTTLSHWQHDRDLEAYRNSELFQTVWGQVKLLFSDRPQAFSLEKLMEL